MFAMMIMIMVIIINCMLLVFLLCLVFLDCPSLNYDSGLSSSNSCNVQARCLVSAGPMASVQDGVGRARPLVPSLMSGHSLPSSGHG